MSPPRRKPLPRRRAKKRTWKSPRCEVQRCIHPQEVKWNEPIARGGIRFKTGLLAGIGGVVVNEMHGMCGKHARLEAHRRLRAFVFARDGGCVIPHQRLFPCSGVLQPNHCFDRDEKAVTWAEWNVMGGCAAINTWAHHNKLRWYEMLRGMWGNALYEERKQVVLNGPPMDVAEVLAKYPPVAKEESE